MVTLLKNKIRFLKLSCLFFSNHLQSFDPFRSQKIEAYNKSLASMEQVGQHLYDVLNKQDVDPKKEFITLLKVNELN